jgi:hypothetical protein
MLILTAVRTSNHSFPSVKSAAGWFEFYWTVQMMDDHISKLFIITEDLNLEVIYLVWNVEWINLSFM